jgi:hypothetical protein
MIDPVLYYVIVTYEEVVETDPQFVKAKAAGIIIARDHEDAQRRNAGIDRGTIVAMGPHAFQDTEKTEKKYVLIVDEDVHFIQR